MADHLMQELRGTGMAWRRDTLKKYRDFVREGSDFPLTEFRSRHSAATEAVGYGKVAMGFHMLRRQLGDDLFRQALQRFYRSNLGSKAAFADVQAAFEATAEQDFTEFFSQWVEWTGAPQLHLDDVRVKRRGDVWRVKGKLHQQQEGAGYTLKVPL
jgi:aminopeptidase N